MTASHRSGTQENDNSVRLWATKVPGRNRGYLTRSEIPALDPFKLYCMNCSPLRVSQYRFSVPKRGQTYVNFSQIWLIFRTFRARELGLLDGP